MAPTHKPRACPKCGTWFSSVQSLGVCPKCRHTFRIGAEGRRERRRRWIWNVSCLVLMLLFLALLALMTRQLIREGLTVTDSVLLGLIVLLMLLRSTGR